MAATAEHNHSDGGYLSGKFNLESMGKMVVEGVVLGAIGYAIWHTGIALPFIEAATPWIVQGLEFLQVDHVFEFMASVIPDFAYEVPPIPVDMGFDAAGGFDAATGAISDTAAGGDLLGLDGFLNE